MRKLLFTVLLLICAGQVSAQTNNCPVSTAPWNCTQGAQNFVNGGGVTSVTAITGVSVPNGQAIIVGAATCWNNTCTSGTGSIAITDGTNTYTCPAGENITGISRTYCYVCNSIGGPVSVTMTMTPAATAFFPSLIWNSFSNSNGAIPPSCLDQTSGATSITGSGTSAAIQTTSPTTRNNDLIWSFIGGVNASTNNSFQYLTQNASTSSSTEIKNGATPGTYPTGWTFASGNWAGVELAFLGPGSSGVPRKHGTFIKFKPDHFRRLPWIIKRNELRIETT